MRLFVLLLFPSVVLAQGYAPQRLPRVVEMTAPDGGLLVTGAVDVSGSIDVDSMPPITGNVVAYPADGGFQITLAGERVGIINPVEVVTPTGVTLGVSGPDGARLGAEVTGVGGGAVVTTATILGTPTVNLSTQALTAIAGVRVCADYPAGNNVVDGGVFEFPHYAGQQNASITFHDFGSAVDYVACWRSSQADGGPVPSCALGSSVPNVPVHQGDTWTVDGLADHHRLRCAACTHAGPPSGGTALAGGTISACTP